MQTFYPHFTLTFYPTSAVFGVTLFLTRISLAKYSDIEIPSSSRTSRRKSSTQVAAWNKKHTAQCNHLDQSATPKSVLITENNQHLHFRTTVGPKRHSLPSLPPSDLMRVGEWSHCIPAWEAGGVPGHPGGIHGHVCISKEGTEWEQTCTAKATAPAAVWAVGDPITRHANSHQQQLSVHLQPRQTVGLVVMVGLHNLRGFFQP